MLLKILSTSGALTLFDKLLLDPEPEISYEERGDEDNI